MHLVPRYRQKLAHVPLRPGPPGVGRRPALQRALPPAPQRAARAGLRRAAAQPRGAPLRPAAGPDQAAVGAQPRRGPRRRPLRDHLEDPPRARRRRQRRRHHVGALRRLARARARRRPRRASGCRVPSRPTPSCWPRRCSSARRCRPRAPAACGRSRARRARSLGQAGEWLVGVGAMAWAGLSPAPPSPFNVPIGPHRRYTWVDSEVARFKAIKNALGGTLNDVVLSAVALALGRFLRRRGVETDGLVLKAMVPVSVRADTQRGALGNRVAAMWAPLPVGRHRSRGGARRGRRGDARDQGVRAGRRRRGADLAGRLRAADDHVAGRAAAGAPALLQPRRHQRPGPADPALPARAPDDPLLSRRAARPPPGAGHRDHEL